MLQQTFPTSPLSTWESLSQHAQQYSSRFATRTPASSQGAGRPPVAVPSHKSTPTCTISLAHAQVVSTPASDHSSPSIPNVGGKPDLAFAPQLSVRQPGLSSKTKSSRTTTNHWSNEVNVIPFPMLSPESSLPPAVSSRPLPIPPKSHALPRMTPMGSPPSSFDVPQVRPPLDPETRRTRRESLSSLPVSDAGSRVVAPVMHRRRSRDPNVADRLVVETDDGDALPPRPDSPSPELHDQANRGQHWKAESAGNASPTSPDQSAPPAYSTLPPPYSPTNTKDKKDAEEQLLMDIQGKEDQPPVTATTLPSPRTHKASIPSPRTSASTPLSSAAGPSSYKRTRVSTSELRVLLYLYRTVVYGLEMRRRKEKDSTCEAKQEPLPQDGSNTKRKPLGPRSSPPTSPNLRTNAVIPEDKYQFERSIASAVSSKVTGKLKHYHRGFGAFPLVEDDLDAPESDIEVDYITPRTPFHSPSQSPRSTPPPILRPLSPIPSALDSKPKQKEKAKAELKTELDVQDKLLSIRLRDFLRAQGVCEEDLMVEFDGENEEDPIEKLVDEVQAESKAPQVLTQDEEEENNILEEYFMGIEEEEDASSAKKERGPVVEDDDEVVASEVQSPFVEDLDMDMGDSTSTPIVPPLQVVIQPTQRISSPPPASPSPRPRAVVPTSYMVALLTMRNRHPSKRPGSSNSGGSGGDKNKEGTGKKKSGLSVVVEAD